MGKADMKYFVISVLLTFASITFAQNQSVTLGNEPWPPYVLSGEKKGTAEKIVCEALERAGWGCTVKRGDWVETLKLAGDGDLDGIAALWHNDKRAESFSFSEPYLTNRLLPVVKEGSGLVIKSLGDLKDLRIVTEEGYAYGDEIENALLGLSVTEVSGSEKTLKAVQSGEADVALIDELAARDYVDQSGNDDLIIGQTALSFRELHFAVSKKHPQQAEIIGAFNNAYVSMLKDGSINRILDIDWVVTDLKFDGVPDFIYRSDGVPGGSESMDTVYAINQGDYQMLQNPNFSSTNANFERNELARQDFRSAPGDELVKKKPCHYDSGSGRVICPIK